LYYKYKSQCIHKGGGEKIEKKNPRGEQTQKTPRGGHYKREHKKKKPRTEGGETKKRRRRAFSSWCLHC
jgi:hypothetical protein